MKKILLLFALFGWVFANGFAQQAPVKWEKWNWLIGYWAGEGSGKPGEGKGGFSFNFDLDKNILVRKNHTEFPATAEKPKSVHNDLLIVYPDWNGNPAKAIYFDNEGHTINYAIAYTEKSIIFTSEKLPGVPVFRLTYTQLEPKRVNIVFEFSQDGEKFTTYIEGKSKKITKK